MFLAGDPFCQGFFLHRYLLCRVGDLRRRRHGLIQEGAFAKGASNPGAAVTEVLAPGAFGRNCAVPCEISK